MKQPPVEEELAELASLGNTSITAMLNPSSKGFKELKLKLEELTDKEAADLINKHPRIMRRPLLSDGKRLLVGFKPDQYSGML